MNEPFGAATPGCIRIGLAPRLSTLRVISTPTAFVLVACGTKPISCPLRWARLSKILKEATVYAVELPPVRMPPAISSRYIATADMSARALSLTDDGACPSAKLIVGSALALLLDVCDQRQRGIRQNPLI